MIGEEEAHYFLPPFFFLVRRFSAGVGCLASSRTFGALFGFGLGAYFPVLNALVVDHTPPRDRGTALGFFTSFMDVGIASGAVVLGLAGEYFGYDAMFFWGAGTLFLSVFVFANAVKSERK